MRIKKVIGLLALAGIFGVFLNNGVKAGITDGLVASYMFDGNANDSSGNNLNGTISGAILAGDRFGNTNSAYYFDGEDDYIEVQNTSGAFNLVNAWTLSAWINPFSSVEGTASGPIIWKTSIVGNNMDTFGMSWEPGDIILSKLERASDDDDLTVFSQSHSINNWYHVVGLYDGDFIKIYINNSLEDQLQIGSVTAYTGPAPLRIGNTQHTSHGNDGIFHGIIDDVLIFDRALSEDEISDLYGDFEAVPAPGALLLGGFGVVLVNRLRKYRVLS